VGAGRGAGLGAGFVAAGGADPGAREGNFRTVCCAAFDPDDPIVKDSITGIACLMAELAAERTLGPKILVASASELVSS
jgi:hypothetical protein